jgi:hypothetical protein
VVTSGDIRSGPQHPAAVLQLPAQPGGHV